ncbi:MAG: hypothetical protein Q4G26_06070 [Paracoccus sp. (in: a-proteobacteria)]|nr:hypothetical protein [Paracoccus sp. (in: a-proteobacteria)]
MADIVLLLGAALCLLSLPVAAMALFETRPPRGAVILFLAGVVLLAATEWRVPGSVGWPQLQAALAGLFG